ncbi:hypothetical protein BH11PSE1_BH11PSE1_17580 [soil metagenome]
MAKSMTPARGKAAKPVASKPAAAKPGPAVIPPTPVPSTPSAVVIGQVTAGATWRFEADGRWTDGFIPCGPNGYKNFAADVLDIRPESAGQNWFALIGRIQGVPDSEFLIGSGCTHTFAAGGTLEVFANDLPEMRDNNRGAISLSGARLPGPLPAVNPLTTPERFRGLMGHWRLLQLVFEQCRSVGVVAVLILAVCAILAFMTQGRDLIRTLGEDGFSTSGAVWRQFSFCIFLMIFAVQAWIWPRMIINTNCGLDRSTWGPGARVLKWIPRLLGLTPFLAVGWALLGADDPNAWILGGMVALTAAIFVFGVLTRNDVGRVLRARFKSAPAAQRLGRGWVMFTTVAGFLALLVFSLWPVGPARWLGAPAVVFLGIGLLIPWIVIPVQFGRIFQIPVVVSVLTLAIFWSAFGAFDNHAVGRRAADAFGAKPHPVAPRLTLDEAYALWSKQAPEDADGRKVMVLAASEGGASRAGFWTGEVLSTLDDRSGGRLRNALFAISSVSGGSVGAVGYDAVLQDNPGIPGAQVRPTLQRLTGADALSPVLGGLLFPDLLYRLLPLPILPDRAEGLERSWERAWVGDGKAHKVTLDQSFLSLAPREGEAWRPILMVNGASEESGRRVITSTIRAATKTDEKGREIPSLDAAGTDAYDFHLLTGRDIPISSAIHNGARFPYVSPAGTLTVAGGGPAQGHVIDGGYFDAVGTETVRELADAVARGPGKADKLRFIFVVIAYEGLTDPNAKGHKPPPPLLTDDAKQVKTVWLANEVMAPPRGFASSRSGHGSHMTVDLRRTFALEKLHIAPKDPVPTTLTDDYQPVMLCEHEGFEYPMNWALSRRAQREMQCAATARRDGDGGCKKACPKAAEAIDKTSATLLATKIPPPQPPPPPPPP